MDHMGGVWARWFIFWGVGDLTVLRFWGFCICECIKIPASEIVKHIHKSLKVIIIVTSELKHTSDLCHL